MRKLIEALEIFAKYQDLRWPTSCAHDTLMIMGITQDEVSLEDQEKLSELGFFWWPDDGGCWMSHRYGSA